jgi:hypothetical protein
MAAEGGYVEWLEKLWCFSKEKQPNPEEFSKLLVAA